MLFIIGAVDSAPARTYTVDMEENVMQVIDSFRGEYSFLSDFHKCKVEFEGTTYPSVEHAFQAAKNPDPEYRGSVAAVGSPVTAKRMGKKTVLRPDREEVKEGIMYELLISKFSDPGLRDKLIATGDAELIEGNNHWDRYWGVCRGEGQNKLGKLLMKERGSKNGQQRTRIRRKKK